ncbi:hypothetical protein ACF08N_37565 [Streptomyces sp. NPDC015127]|uniref:hypothetical protein n=1 Tax=Streptomyces sp. NPDC015127 TaxID=3364939 RepID=UPI0036FFBF86
MEHFGTTGTTGIVDGTEVRIRRPTVGRKDRDKFISDKKRQNAVKAMVAALTDEDGRMRSALRSSREAARTSRTPASWSWLSSWPTVPQWRSSPCRLTGVHQQIVDLTAARQM